MPLAMSDRSRRAPRVIGCAMLLGCGVLMLASCEQPAPPPPPPAPVVKAPEPEPEPTPPPAEKPPEPAPMPVEPPPQKPVSSFQKPSHATHAVKWRSEVFKGRPGAVFLVSFRMVSNPDNAELRVTLIDNKGNRLTYPAKRAGEFYGIEEFVPGAGAAGAPYHFGLEYMDRELGEWKILVEAQQVPGS